MNKLIDSDDSSRQADRAWQPETWYRDPKVAASYDDRRFTSWSGRRGDRKEKTAFSKLLQQVGPVQRALDVPCGTGRMTEVLLTRAIDHVVGCDLSPEMMSHAARKLARFGSRVEFIEGNIQAMPFSDGEFELVSCVRLFGHFPSELRVNMLKEMKRVSHRWLIIQYFCSTPITRFKRLVKRRVLNCYQGVTHPATSIDIEREIRDAGLHEHSRRWCRKHYSEEVFLLLSTV